MWVTVVWFTTAGPNYLTNTWDGLLGSFCSEAELKQLCSELSMFTLSQIRRRKKKKTAQFWVLKNASANQSMSNRTANTALTLTPYSLKHKLCSFITKIYDLLFTVYSFPPPKLFSFGYRLYTQIFTSWTSGEVLYVHGGTKKNALLPLFIEAVVTDFFASRWETQWV